MNWSVPDGLETRMETRMKVMELRVKAARMRAEFSKAMDLVSASELAEAEALLGRVSAELVRLAGETALVRWALRELL